VEEWRRQERRRVDRGGVMTCSECRWARRRGPGTAACPAAGGGWAGWSLGRRGRASSRSAAAATLGCSAHGTQRSGDAS